MNQFKTNNSELRTIFIVGPTASGKTALSVELAKQLDAEIICADSQTIRRGMDIGTAKPSAEEQQGVPHHMIDIIDPYDEFSLADFQRLAKDALSDIQNRNKQAIVVGGTGLYVDSLFFNYQLPELARTLLATRRVLANQSVEGLKKIVAERGLEMPKNDKNRRHLINVILRDGKVGERHEPNSGYQIIGINPGKEILAQRINERVDAMFEAGFIDEVRSILSKYGQPPREFDAIGYRIVMRHLGGEMDESSARELFKIADRQYAKRQISWLNRNPHITWFETPGSVHSYILDL